MVSIKCNNCGANMNIEETKKTIKCEYCGGSFENPSYQKTTTYRDIMDSINSSIRGRIDNSFNGANNRVNNPLDPYPEVNYVILIFALMFYVFPAFIYLNHVKNKQKKWEKRNLNR